MDYPNKSWIFQSSMQTAGQTECHQRMSKKGSTATLSELPAFELVAVPIWFHMWVLSG